VGNVYETDLAWALVEVAKQHLAARERFRVFVIVGAGDTFAAISLLLGVFSARRIPLRSDLVQRCTKWLENYAGHEDEQLLRHLIDGYLMMPGAAGASPMVRFGRSVTTPKRSEPLPV
jgi:hypothetical protein